MKPGGRRHTYAEKLLMGQVAVEFTKRKKEKSAKKAARELGVSVPSFYNYVAWTDLPRMEVLAKAQRKWGIRWKNFDLSQFTLTIKTKPPEQYTLPFLDAIREKDIEVFSVVREGENVLRVALKIHFAA
jgi:hypothetical protein